MRPQHAVLAIAVYSLVSLSCGAAPAPVDLDRELAAARELQINEGPRAALSSYERLLAAARSQGSRRHEGLVLGQMGTAQKNLGEYGRALRLHEESLAIKREIGDEVEVAKTLSNLGLVKEAQGDCNEALRLYSQSLEIFTRKKTPRFAASVLNNQGLCFDALGDYRQSAKAYQAALLIHRQQENAAGVSETLGNLGGVALLLGKYRRRRPITSNRWQSAGESTRSNRWCSISSTWAWRGSAWATSPPAATI